MIQKQPSLVVSHLKKRFKKRTVVEDVSLSMYGGQVVGLLGPNGAGKTTSFYMIVGLIAADGGEVILDDHKITRMPIHERSRLGLGYLPQEASIFRQMTVEENVLAVLEVVGVPKKDQKSRMYELLEELHLTHLRQASALSLSGGERRRVEIARVLAGSPKFILLDEPFAGVDPIAVIDIQNVISFLKEKGIGILITDHNVRETLRICDHAYIISEGSVLAEGHPDILVEDELVRKVYLGEHFSL
jgi:lipopolysaccharide export system ATP-binding protein